jgi:hypothetical protein
MLEPRLKRKARRTGFRFQRRRLFIGGSMIVMVRSPCLHRIEPELTPVEGLSPGAVNPHGSPPGRGAGPGSKDNERQ